MKLHMSSPEYKSPPHKLIKFFHDSRDKWEEKAKERRKEIRDLNARVRDLEVSRNLWKENAKTATEQAQTQQNKLLEIEQELSEAKAGCKTLQKECEELMATICDILL